MSDSDDEEDYGDELESSVALPPLYVLRTSDLCPDCDAALYVYSLGCTAFVDAAEGYPPVEEFHFLHHIRKLPPDIEDMIRAKCPGYYLDDEEAGEEPYLMNHCPCGARLDDEHQHGDVGAAFSPDTPDGFAQIKLFKLPIAEPIAVECSYTIGGGEYLDFDKAAPW